VRRRYKGLGCRVGKKDETAIAVQGWELTGLMGEFDVVNGFDMRN